MLASLPSPKGLPVFIHGDVVQIEDAGVAAVATAGVQVRLLGWQRHGIGDGGIDHGGRISHRRQGTAFLPEAADHQVGLRKVDPGPVPPVAHHPWTPHRAPCVGPNAEMCRQINDLTWRKR